MRTPEQRREFTRLLEDMQCAYCDGPAHEGECVTPPLDTGTDPRPHVHDWERGQHMADAFGIDGRILACAICGQPKRDDPISDARQPEDGPPPGRWPR